MSYLILAIYLIGVLVTTRLFWNLIECDEDDVAEKLIFSVAAGGVGLLWPIYLLLLLVGSFGRLFPRRKN